MSAPIPLRQNFDASQLRGLARRRKDGPQTRRLLALAAIDCDTKSGSPARLVSARRTNRGRHAINVVTVLTRRSIGRIP
jgi:hypothetical protein